VTPEVALDALTRFEGVKRRLELRGTVRGVAVYDDFAHHPTAITLTVEGLRRQVGEARILAVLEPRSNTMKLGVMKDQLPASLTRPTRSSATPPTWAGTPAARWRRSPPRRWWRTTWTRWWRPSSPRPATATASW
jgi:hypothetical protein